MPCSPSSTTRSTSYTRLVVGAACRSRRCWSRLWWRCSRSVQSGRSASGSARTCCSSRPRCPQLMRAQLAGRVARRRPSSSAPRPIVGRNPRRTQARPETRGGSSSTPTEGAPSLEPSATGRTPPRRGHRVDHPSNSTKGVSQHARCSTSAAWMNAPGLRSASPTTAAVGRSVYVEASPRSRRRASLSTESEQSGLAEGVGEVDGVGCGVDAAHAGIGVAEELLNDRRRDAAKRELHAVGVAQGEGLSRPRLGRLLPPWSGDAVNRRTVASGAFHRGGRTAETG
jgi:hypothetical protein